MKKFSPSITVFLHKYPLLFIFFIFFLAESTASILFYRLMIEPTPFSYVLTAIL